MSIQITARPDFVINQAIPTGAPTVLTFPKLWTGNSNAASFQLQWNSALTAGTFTLYGSNMSENMFGEASAVTYPIPLTPIALASIDVSMSPYSTNLAGGFDVVTAYNWLWVTYSGVGGGTVSIATNVKSYG